MGRTSRILLTVYHLLSFARFTLSDITPLVNKRFRYPDGIPFRADTDEGERGTQVGLNRCNSSTAGQESLCQTSFLNSVDDFCLWAPIDPGSQVGDVEGSMVAWCTKPGHGTRVIPPGAITGVQFMQTPDYVQVVGFIDQTKINIAAGDFGGEMDPHGADARGNPLGGLMYSNAYTKDKNHFEQVIEWHNFMGSNQFCLKACDPAKSNAANYCQHIYDRIGCAYNAPSNAQKGVFEACKGDNQDFPGIYTDANGMTQTYTQPPESLGPIGSIPYTARVPKSSDCSTFESAALFAGSVTPGTGGGVSATMTSSSASGKVSSTPLPPSMPRSFSTISVSITTVGVTSPTSVITTPTSVISSSALGPDVSGGSQTAAPTRQTSNSSVFARGIVSPLALIAFVISQILLQFPNLFGF